MSELLPLSLDELLTTTRAVRKRLDFDREVPFELVQELIEIAVQAPSGSNKQGWQWVVVTDPEKKKSVADIYRKAYYPYAELGRQHAKDNGNEKVVASSSYLAENFEKAPVFIIACIEAELTEGNQATIWGSILPAAWNLCLAARARGLGTAWTTLHLAYEAEVAKVLGIPAGIRQGVLLPLAYTKGTDFKPGPRRDLSSIVHHNTW